MPPKKPEPTKGHTPGPQFVSVMTNGNKGLETFRIHRRGCRDVEKEVAATSGHSWEERGATAEDVLKKLKANQEADDNILHDDQYRILPCAILKATKAQGAA